MAGGSINKVILIGNLGRDPEMRYTQDQNAVATFSVATSEQWTDRNTNERRERTEWHRIVCFRRLAEICGEYLHKGSKVYIEGQLQTRSWEQDGQTRYMTEVVARQMQMLDSRGSGGGGGFGGPEDRGGPPDRGGYGNEPSRSGSSTQPSSSPPAEPDDFEDDIPF
ncbi:MAG: single-stranded DNA-binding protein [Gammaproteobacteria bacterium]|nr:single-stranded DNA-binding protein [Gammaproteobacteria bacterium]